MIYKKAVYIFVFFATLIVQSFTVKAQLVEQKNDTFFLAKQKGLLGRFGKSISRTNAPDEPPQKLYNPFLKFKGKIIRSVILFAYDFGSNICDTCVATSDFGTRISKVFHKSTTAGVIHNNLFFKTGDKIYPYLLADNERYLRELVYLRDARIVVEYVEGGVDSVDVLVLTQDIFSIGININISSPTRARVELRDENFLGSGNRIQVSGFYDKVRNPVTGWGAEFIKRNIKGTFLNFTAGFQNYNSAFNSGRYEESAIYTRLEKPLVTPFIPLTGAVEWGYYKTRNAYVSDSLYNIDFKYEYYNVDGWLGYSLDNKKSLYANREIKTHRFVAIRGFTQRFLNVPFKYKNSFDYRYTDFTGVLASLNIFKHTFYKTKFIYGFGRNEDIPEGFSIVLTGGYINKESIMRPYSGLDVQYSKLGKKGAFYNYTFRTGGYFYKERFEDADLLFNLEHFSRLRKISSAWYQRFFINTSITAQVNPVLNTPLFLNSEYGLPYLRNEGINADMRTTFKGESVFYNTQKILGFRLAPFVFMDMSLLKPIKSGLQKTELYSGFGGGVRTRNENLVFGTVELRGYYFPGSRGYSKNWKIELNGNIRFKYRSSFIRRPDFIIVN